MVSQILHGGHIGFYDTVVSEASHKKTITWAGLRVRLRETNQTQADMLSLVWEDMMLSDIGSQCLDR